jgi:hypothetical protein
MGWRNLSKTAEKVPPAHAQRVYGRRYQEYSRLTLLLYHHVLSTVGHPLKMAVVALEETDFAV